MSKQSSTNTAKSIGSCVKCGGMRYENCTHLCSTNAVIPSQPVRKAETHKEWCRTEIGLGCNCAAALEYITETPDEGMNGQTFTLSDARKIAADALSDSNYRKGVVVMGNTLSKTKTIMHRGNSSLLDLMFECEGGEEEIHRDHRLVLDRDVWDDMGQPDTITVTIEPGDTLNADDA